MPLVAQLDENDEREQAESYRMEVSSALSGEKAVYVPGEGTKVLETNEEEMRNTDEVLEEKCNIPKPNYDDRCRVMCMDFCYFEREVEVYS